MNELTPIFGSILQALLIVLVPSLAVALFALISIKAREYWQTFQANQPVLAEQLAFYARIAVEAAEQAGAAQLIDNKKTYAINIAQNWLNQAGIPEIRIDLIEAEIERQVRQMRLQTPSGRPPLG